MTFTHEQQQKAWEAEHAKPTALPQMNSRDGSSGVVKFLEFLKEFRAPMEHGLEMGCGKGRNVIYLVQQGVRDMHGFDFSPVAIEEARRRAHEAHVVERTTFTVADATVPWEYEDEYFDFGIDCFASTDIVSPEGREFATREMMRVLKPGGYFLAYLLSTDDEFHKEMILKNPAPERNAFLHETGKFEKTFDGQEVRERFKELDTVRFERIEKTTEFSGKPYQCKHFWVVLRKPRHGEKANES
jgi:SAM-dependent methyltransferase